MVSIQCLKRVQNELKALDKDPIYNIDVFHEPNNMLVWYFLIVGIQDPYKGHYIGQINLPENYPKAPPQIQQKTPSGRFHLNKNICLSNTGFHKDTWSSAWNISSILMGFYSIMLEEMVESQGVGYIRATEEERKKLALQSFAFNKKHYPEIYKKFKRFVDPTSLLPIPIMEKKEVKEGKEENPSTMTTPTTITTTTPNTIAPTTVKETNNTQKKRPTEIIEIDLDIIEKETIKQIEHPNKKVKK